jgi:hypothetical protein
MEIQFFIIFHKNIFDECYKNIPDDILYKYFTFFGVNKNIEKKIVGENPINLSKYKIINEWELPIYDSTFQERGYNENSALYHIYVNELYKNYKYIGFFQYDMKFEENIQYDMKFEENIFEDNIINFLQKNINETPKCFCDKTYTFNYCEWDEPNTLNYIINDYENYFNKSFSRNNRYPLFNTYIIPVETYKKIMGWIIQLYDKLYPWCVEPPNKIHWGHIGGIYERIMGYAIGEEYLSFVKINIKHDHHYKGLSY